MPPPLLIDLTQVDLTAVCLDRNAIYEHLPHRHEFSLLDGVCHLDVPGRSVVAFRNVTTSDWWVRAHIPGRPLLPGVLMLEMAAQVAALLARLSGKYPSFTGFGGVDQCKFRESVVPPTRLYLLVVGTELRPRRFRCDSQGVANGRLIFEAEITGVVMPEP